MLPVIWILLIVVGLPMGIGLIAILTEHQRKMAEIIHKSSHSSQVVAQLKDELQRVKDELAETRDLVNRQVLANDQVPMLSSEHSVESIERGAR